MTLTAKDETFVNVYEIEQCLFCHAQYWPEERIAEFG